MQDARASLKMKQSRRATFVRCVDIHGSNGVGFTVWLLHCRDRRPRLSVQTPHAMRCGYPQIFIPRHTFSFSLENENISNSACGIYRFFKKYRICRRQIYRIPLAEYIGASRRTVRQPRILIFRRNINLLFSFYFFDYVRNYCFKGGILNDLIFHSLKV